MGSSGITRSSEVFDVTADTSGGGTSTIIPFGGWAGASVVLPAGAASQVINVHGTHDLGGTFYQLYDKDGAIVTITAAASRVHDLPTACYALAGIKLVAADSKEEDLTIFCKG